MRNKSAIYFMIPIGILSAIPAFAYRGEGVNMAVLRQDWAENAVKTIRVEGTLRCNRENEAKISANRFENCALNIIENNSGRAYKLSNGSAAMRLFMNGAQKVAIEGTMADADTIEVKSAETL